MFIPGGLPIRIKVRGKCPLLLLEWAEQRDDFPANLSVKPVRFHRVNEGQDAPSQPSKNASSQSHFSMPRGGKQTNQPSTWADLSPH